MYHLDKDKMSDCVPFCVLDGIFVLELRPLKSLETWMRIAVILLNWCRLFHQVNIGVHVAAIYGSVIRFTGVSFEGRNIETYDCAACFLSASTFFRENKFSS